MGFTSQENESIKYEVKESNDTVQNFRKLLGQINKENFHKQGLIIFIDEFDVIQDKTGLGSLFKACTNDFIKFSIVGISESFTKLLTDHESIFRFSYPIEIKKMLDNELNEIIKKAENRIEHYFIIDDEARNYIIQLAGGFPYFVHLIGKETFYLALERGQKTINKETVETVFTRITEGRLVSSYETLYLETVNYSDNREVIMVLFAEEKNTIIPTKEIYKTARELGIKSPSTIVNTLVKNGNSKPVLTKISNGKYSFIDPIFKVYVRIRGMRNSTTNILFK